MKKIFTFVLLCAAMIGTATAATVEINATLGYAQYFGYSADWYMELYDEESGNGVVLDIFSEDYTSVTGTYSTEDFDLDYTLAIVGQSEIAIKTASATITRDGNTTKIAATLVSEDGDTYNVTFNNQFYGMEEDIIETSNTEYALQYDEEEELTLLYIDVMDEEGESGVEFALFFAGLPADATSVPAGVYTIDGSGKAGTVVAEYSMVATYSWYDGDALNEPGYYYDVQFYLVGGTVTVSEKDGISVVAIEGVDYVGSSINLTYTGELSKTDVKNAKADTKVEKSLRNGQLIIERNGVRYNVAGIKF